MNALRIPIICSAIGLGSIIPAAAATFHLDFDGDGYSDIWQTHYDLDAVVPGVDSDCDGIEDSDERAAGTNPLDPASAWRVVTTQVHSITNTIALQFISGEGKVYRIQRSGDLPTGPWVNLGASQLSGATGLMELERSIGGLEAPHHFRISVSDIDADGDGLTAWEEAIIGTSDRTRDTNGRLVGDDRSAAMDWLDDHGVPGAGTSGNLKEVDVAWLRSGSTSLSVPGIVVTAAGSGGEHVLTTWTLDPNGRNLQAADNTDPAPGHHTKVLRLETSIVSSTANQPFISGTIREDGNLWISSRAATPSGDLVHHQTLGFGSNADLTIHDYDMAVRPVFNGFFVSRYVVVTPVISSEAGSNSKRLHLVSWRFNLDGSMTGLDHMEVDSAIQLDGDADKANLRVDHVNGIQFVLSYTNRFDLMENVFFWAEDDGDLFDFGGSNGESFSGEYLEPIEQGANAIAGFTTSGHVTANRALDGSLSLSVWERRQVGFLDSSPHLISDNTRDLSPNANGVHLPAPQLTNSWTYPIREGDTAGRAVAVGDFDGNGLDDAVIGAPASDIDDQSNAGAVYIIKGDFAGLSASEFSQKWSQGTPGVNGLLEADDNFGFSLAVGDFNGDGIDDLAVGSPGDSVGNIPSGGAVSVFLGTVFGLSTANNIIFTQEGLGHISRDNDRFGYTLAAGDFDGDGEDDLAIGTPFRSVAGNEDAGVVYVVRGGNNGLLLGSATLWHQNTTGIYGGSEAGDQFGRALATGNFNNDHCEDLAVGVPFEDIGAAANAGGVQVMYGANGGGFESNVFISQNGFTPAVGDLHESSEANDWFGLSLAAGDFDGDNRDDLAIGVMGEDLGGVDNTGGVAVVYGSNSGLSPTGNQFIGQDVFTGGSGSLSSISEAGDQFGEALTAGDFDGDGFHELAVGIPLEDEGSTIDSGAVVVISGSEDGLHGNGEQVLVQSISFAGANEAGDWFGDALAVGDFNADGETDILIGIPFEDVTGNISCEHVNAGAAGFGYGSESGIGSNHTWVVRKIETVRGIVSELALEDSIGSGSGQLYAKGSFLPEVHMASVTKVMTLLLAVEAIEDGEVALSDLVEISERAGTTGGSKMALRDEGGVRILDDDGNAIPFLETGDVMPLRLLLHGMMMESGNRASVAIGEHVANAINGDPETFLDLMQDRADDLNMATVYGHPAGGSVSNLQDQLELLREGWKHSRFRDLMRVELYGTIAPSIELCGEDSGGAEKCTGPIPRLMTIGEYLGREGAKGGNGRLWWGSGDESAVEPDATHCTSSALAMAKRLDTDLMICLQQTGSRTGDAGRLLDHGFRKVFTPDARGEHEFPQPGGIVGPDGPIRVQNFAVDHVAVNQLVTAVIDDNEQLRLNVWGVSLGNGSFTSLANASIEPALCFGFVTDAPTLVELVKMPGNGQSMRDYCTINISGTHLEMKLWRIGQRP